MKSSEPVKETVQTTQSPTPVEKETVVTTQAEVFPPPVAMLQVSVEVGLFFFSLMCSFTFLFLIMYLLYQTGMKISISE